MYIWSSLELLHQQEGGPGGPDPTALLSALSQEEDVLMGDRFWDFCRHSYPALQGGNAGTCTSRYNGQKDTKPWTNDGNDNWDQISLNISQNNNNSTHTTYNGDLQGEPRDSCDVPLRQRRLGCSDKLHLDVTMTTRDATSRSPMSCIKDMTDMEVMLSPLPLTPGVRGNDRVEKMCQ